MDSRKGGFEIIASPIPFSLSYKALVCLPTAWVRPKSVPANTSQKGATNLNTIHSRPGCKDDYLFVLRQVDLHLNTFIIEMHMLYHNNLTLYDPEWPYIYGPDKRGALYQKIKISPQIRYNLLHLLSPEESNKLIIIACVRSCLCIFTASVCPSGAGNWHVAFLAANSISPFLPSPPPSDGDSRAYHSIPPCTQHVISSMWLTSRDNEA